MSASRGRRRPRRSRVTPGGPATIRSGRLAEWIQARTIARCGELRRQIRPAKNQHDRASGDAPTRVGVVGPRGRSPEDRAGGAWSGLRRAAMATQFRTVAGVLGLLVAM